MSKVLVTEAYLNNIAEAIRSKNGSSATYTPGQMAGAIEAIPTGGITPTGTVNITQNGTHDVTQYASANVNVQPVLQSKTANQNGTVTPDAGYDGLSSVVVSVSGGDSYFKRLTPIHFDLTGGYVGNGYWYYGDNTSRTDIYEVSQNKRYLLMLGADAGNRLRSAFFTTDPANATGNISGTLIWDNNAPGPYSMGVSSLSNPVPFVSPSNGYIGFGKTNQGIDGITSYVFEIQF